MAFKTLAIGLTLACSTLSAGTLLADSSPTRADGAIQLAASGNDVSVDAGAQAGTGSGGSTQDGGSATLEAETGQGGVGQEATRTDDEAQRRLQPGHEQAEATVEGATDRAERQLRQRREQAAANVEGATDAAEQALDAGGNATADVAGAAGGGASVSGTAEGDASLN